MHGISGTGESTEPERKRVDHSDRLKHYLVQGVIRDEYIPIFFSQIRKVAGRLKGALAAVTMTDSGIQLIYDTEFMATATDDEIDFVLSHELMHVLDLHFLRGFDLMEELHIPQSLFFAAYAPLADAPVNHALEELNGFKGMKKKLLTYDKLPEKVEYDRFPSFESVVHYMLENYTQEEMMKMFEKLGVKVVKVMADGSAQEMQQHGNGNGPVVHIPEMTREAQREHMQDVKDLVDAASKAAGNAPEHIRRALDKFLDEYNNRVLRGWDLLKHFLVGYRTINKGNKKTLRRLNRRTLMLPGKIRIKGFRALFLVDESGSMDDEDVKLGLALGRHCILKDNADRLFYIHWDTEPASDVEEVKSDTDLESIERKKCGGTDFSDLLTHELVRTQSVDLHVVITDGYPCRWPENSPAVPLVWIITTSGGFEAWKTQYGKGIAVCVEEEETKER